MTCWRLRVGRHLLCDRLAPGDGYHALLRSERGHRLSKLRSELVERSFAHLYDSGGMRCMRLRGRDDILKRLLIHAAAFNMALLVRKLYGIVKRRTLPGRLRSF